MSAQATGESRQKPTHIPGLDGLRVMAIFAVLLCHANMTFSGEFPASGIERTIATIFGAGWVGVDLFFVLSGFLITGILVRSKGSEHYFRNFYMRRALRILPVYYLYCAIIYLCFWLPKGHPEFGRIEFLSVLTYWYNVRAAFVGHYLPATGHLWSLSVEEHFYLVWPLLVLVLDRVRLRKACIFVAIGSLTARLILLQVPHGFIASYVLTPCRLDALCLGAFLALLDEPQKEWLRHNGRFVALSALACLAAIAAYQGHLNPLVESGVGWPGTHSSRLMLTVGITALAVFFTCAVFRCIAGGRMTRALEAPVLRWIGKRSYGIYVFHQLVLDQLAARLVKVRGLQGLPGYQMKFVILVLTAGVVLPLAALSYRFVELPFLRMKRFFPAPAGAEFATAQDVQIASAKAAHEPLVPALSDADQ
jgi:peptidoglycan/LPS O-acetylase OafA/YrhL